MAQGRSLYNNHKTLEVGVQGKGGGGGARRSYREVMGRGEGEWGLYRHYGKGRRELRGGGLCRRYGKGEGERRGKVGLQGRCEKGGGEEEEGRVGVSREHYGKGDESSTTLKFHVTCLPD